MPPRTALLLLCCALGQAIRPLTGPEFSELRRRLHAKPPADGAVRAAYLRSLGYGEDDAARIVALLSRTEVLERYLRSSADCSVLTPYDADFPPRLTHLKELCPPALFCKGERALLKTRCVALVGSRALNKPNLCFAERIGMLAAQERLTLVSGDAHGADRAAQQACLLSGGSVICFVPDELARHSPQKNVLFCSDEGFRVPFSCARALRRNAYIHALGEKTFVAQCADGSGGSWSGSMLNLRRKLSELHVYADGSAGAAALLARGAIAAPAEICAAVLSR